MIFQTGAALLDAIVLAVVSKEEEGTYGSVSYTHLIYVKKVRTYAKSMKVEEAVDRAVRECINEGILREFLLQRRLSMVLV